MDLKSNFEKFKKHFKAGGVFFAVWRGIKYFIFLIKVKIIKNRQKESVLPGIISISKDKIKIVYENKSVKVYWNNLEVTKCPGLNSAVNTLGLWTNSFEADWSILEKVGDFCKFKVVFKYLPVTQIWDLKIESEEEIQCNITMEVEEDIVIDEYRVVSFVSSNYKVWINGYEQGDFPQVRHWQDILLGESILDMVGARFPAGSVSLPPFVFVFRGNDFIKPLPLIQNTSKEIDAHVVGMRCCFAGEKKYWARGKHEFFSGSIFLFDKEEVLDKEMESFRRIEFKTVKNSLSNKIKIPKVLLVNFPWQRGEKWGVRAGSRWPHIKDVSESNYMPFPFFMAYAAALLKENDIEAEVIDAIALRLEEDKFMEEVLKKDFDFLVVETSVPSFYYDLKLLKKLFSFGVSIILCGHCPDIYNPEFLERNRFVNFVLFGEYEFTLLDLIRVLAKGTEDFSLINGLIWRDSGGKFVKNISRPPFDINLLPWPERESLPMEKYWDLPGDIPYPSVQMLASRGCPFSCSFCLWPQVFFGKRTYRVRDVDDCVSEMEYLVRKRGFKSVYFDDDTFNVGKQRMLEFCGQIIERGLNNVPWAIMAKADLMDEEILDKMKEAGLFAVKYGIESAAQDLVDRCGKCLDLKKAERMILYTKSLGIKVHLTFSFGLPGETKETIQRSIDYALRLDPQSVQFSIVTPFPGTVLFDQLDREGRIVTKDWSLYDGNHSCVFQPDQLSSSDLEEAKKYAYQLWLDHQRRKRGFWGDVERFFHHYQSYGVNKAVTKTIDYLGYLVFRRREFVVERWEEK